ncbi:fungal-specific transcription factor domain-containing protein [Aspergillus karnatakaensis]|uniref:transcription factor domain-containing protein n=1 Tax=Aspergillus karnatakaensis TaxID=1810916 RepID=UPI003CCD1C08
MTPSRSKARKYGFACLQCRRRKVKCDGRRPTCVNCSRSKETCHYKDHSVFVARLTEDLQVCKTRLQELESQIEEIATLDPASRDHRLAELVSQLRQRRQDEQEQPIPSAEECSPTIVDHERQVLSGDVSYDGAAHFSLDVDGRQQYYGATSRFHAPPASRSLAGELEDKATALQEMQSYHQKWLTSNSRFQESWERIAYASISEYTQADPTLCASLLQVYWAWQAPLHNCVYRRAFFRDMALRGPYFSKFLFNIILAHACRHMPDDDPRFAPFERGEAFLREAMVLLIEEMQQSKPRIPTIQGLLILGGRQCAVGKSSEGWLYTGMAIRMVTDLGLHLKRGSLGLTKDFEPDDLEVRKRLYLSVYAWDKSISLCLGRPPSLKEMPYTSSALFDLSDDQDLWQPPHLLETDKIYPETRCHSTLTFKYFCNLTEIINESYSTVYNEASCNINPTAIFALEKKLHSFHEHLPASLRIDDAASLQTCVPPHILCLNILYHTILILTYRPFFAWRWHVKLREHPLALRAQAVCIEQTIDVNKLFRAYGRLFNFQYQSYLISYCVYTAATIDVQLMQHDDKAVAEVASDRLSITLQMLETEVKQTPGIRRSIEIIRSTLDPQWSSGSQLWTDSRNQRNTLSDKRNRPYFRPLAARTDIARMQHQLHTPLPTAEEQGLYTPSVEDTVAERTDLPLIDGMQQLVDMNPDMQIETSWLGWNLDDYDFGGGFVPDMAYWGSFGQPFQ